MRSLISSDMVCQNAERKMKLIRMMHCILKNESTGCPGSKFATSKSFYSETVHVRPQVGKAKMCLRDIHFRGQNFIFEKILKK